MKASLALARHAMATRFEIVLWGRDEVRLRAAGEAALDEIDRIESHLSLYRPGSDIARVNERAAHEAVRVEPETFRLLQAAMALARESTGAFDITVAPLVRAYGFMNGQGAPPDPGILAKARRCVGFQHVSLGEGDCTVRFDQAGVMLDLGAIGKGYALDRAIDILREVGIENAMIHGGTSSVAAIGLASDEQPWKVAIEYPPEKPEEPGTLLSWVELRDSAMSVSAVWGRAFKQGDRLLGHVIDPRTGEPVSHALLSAVVLPSATETDALSTALLTLGASGFDAIRHLRPGIQALLLGANPGGQGFWTRSEGLEVHL